MLNLDARLWQTASIGAPAGMSLRSQSPLKPAGPQNAGRLPITLGSQYFLAYFALCPAAAPDGLTRF
jgi:hypothetical protein